MNWNRRNFIKVGSILVPATMLGGFSCVAGDRKAEAESTDSLKTLNTDSMEEAVKSKFGIQLYTLRDIMPKDPTGVIKQLASFGYSQIENYEGPKGLWWGMTPEEMKRFLDGEGLHMISTHLNANKKFEEKLEQAQKVGLKYMIAPWVGPQKSIDKFREIAEQFNKWGELCKEAGMRFAYHNHAYSFEKVDGEYPQAVMMDSTDPELVDFEMDVYWVVVGGQDPLEWMKKYPGRFKLAHIKDREKIASEGDKHVTCDLGTGSIDYKKLIPASREYGMEVFLLEQEQYKTSKPIDAAKIGAEYLKKAI